MREYMGIFRGKRIENGEWVEGGLMVGVPHELWQNKGRAYICVFPQYFSRVHLIEVDPDTIGECTGFKDKNGKLIFEHQIIKSHGKPYKVCMEVGEWRLIDKWDHYCELYKYAGSGEIIGNIHDNPKLLKGGK